MTAPATPATSTPTTVTPAPSMTAPPPKYNEVPVAERLSVAYSLLGITRNGVRRQPYITPQIRVIASLLRKHQRNVSVRSILLSYLQASDDPLAHKFLDVYRSVPYVWARLLPVEAFCVAGCISTMRLLEVLTASAVRHGAQASAIIAATMHPSVMEATVRSALSDGPDAHADRVVLHKITGSLPQPKGAQTIIQLSQSQSQGQAQQAAAIAAPPPESTIRRFIDRFNDARGQSPRQLPAASHAVTLDDVMDTSPAAAEPAEPAFRVPVPLSRRPMPEIVMDAEPGEDDDADADARED